MKIDLDEHERKATAAIGTDHNPHANWRVDGRTLWSGAGTAHQQAHPLCSFHLDEDPHGMRPPPKGTAATLTHIAANSPHVTLALIARIRELEVGMGKAMRAHAGSSLQRRELLALLEKGAVLP